MANYKNVTGTATTELLSRGSNYNNITSILLASVNGSGTAATVDLYIQDTSANSFYLLKGTSIPDTVSLALTDNVKFDNSSNGYALYIKLGAGAVDVHIKQN